MTREIIPPTSPSRFPTAMAALGGTWHDWINTGVTTLIAALFIYRCWVGGAA